MAPSGSSSAQARLREALAAGGPGSKEKGPPVADGILTVTPDTAEAIDFRKRQSTFDSVASSSSFLEDETGPKPSELYGKFTWKIENFTELQKRELRSNVFEVGSYKWYILVYPQGCDVSNHLSLFLCVADYDKLLPGWSHFAQFTIAVVNKDPKKSKYSDTLHRFCKKEHDWGWKKFMELSKVLEGFTVNNTLLIKAQVQVIRDRPYAPFRCLDAQYRRELVRVYLTNVETICRKFVDEKKAELERLSRDITGFHAFIESLDAKRRKLLMFKADSLLKAIVRRFFNEKEVTSTLVMDALFSGCKQLEEAGAHSQANKGKKDKPGVVINSDRNQFLIVGDITALLYRISTESISHSREEKTTDLSLRNAQVSDESSKDIVERDEKRLAELGKRAVEMLAVSLIFKEVEVAHNEAVSLELQDALIREEEEGVRLSDERQASRLAVEREKKARKKERKRAKKVEEGSQSMEKKKEDVEGVSRLDEAASKKTSVGSSAGANVQVPAQLANGQISHIQKKSSPKESLDLPSAKEEPMQESSSRADPAAKSTEQTDERSQSDDEVSTASHSASEERASISAQQYEEHIEYLKGELARSTSQLNSSRAELEGTREAFRQAQVQISRLKSKLTEAQAELASRGNPNPPEPSSCDSSRPSTASTSTHEEQGGSENLASEARQESNLLRGRTDREQDGANLSREGTGNHANKSIGQKTKDDQEFQPGKRQHQGTYANGHSRLNGMTNQPSTNRTQSGGSSQNGQSIRRPQEVGGRGNLKPSNVLNGNAPSFIPASSAGLTNGHHIASYRNVAAGLISHAGSGDLTEPPKLPQVKAVRNLDGGASGLGLAKGVASANSSQPATPRSGESGTPLAQSRLNPNHTDGSSFSPKSFRVGSQVQHGVSQFSSPPQQKRPDASVGMESPGLDDFAHMGLITDLLE